MGKTKELVKSLLIAIVLSLVVRATVVEAFWIPTGSMRPTVMENDRVMSLKFVYLFAEPRPGDIVVFRPPVGAHPGAERFLKRVVGVGNDLIEVRGGTLWRNGMAVSEPYVLEPPDYTLPLTRIPEGYVFVLGDNRRNSYDSHAWGFLPEENVIARAVFRYWPPARVGLVR